MGPLPAIEAATSNGMCASVHVYMPLVIFSYIEPDLAFNRSFRIHRVGVDICWDRNETHAGLVLNCPVMGYDYLTERAPVVRTWSKVTDNCREDTDLYCASDSSNPRKDYDSAPEFWSKFPGLLRVVGFGLDYDFLMIREHSLVFTLTSDVSIDLARRSLGTWKCTLSNRNGSTSVLTTISICGEL